MKNYNDIEASFPFLTVGVPVLVAVSGGVDSIVLAHILQRLGCKIQIIHCNFQLRGEESDKDALFVEGFSRQLGVPFHLKVFNKEDFLEIRQQSTQMIARKLRYQWFYELLNQTKAMHIAIAHHLDDSLETFFINFLRGTGIRGLLGIPNQNKKIIRPLSLFSQQDILKYAKKHYLTWREDGSNAKKIYKRNQIRHDLIPVLKDIEPHVLKNFQQTLDYLKGSLGILEAHIQSVKSALFIPYKKGYRIAVDSLQKLNPIKDYVYELFLPYGFTQWDDIIDLLEAQSGKKIYSEKYYLLKDRLDVILQPIDFEEVENCFKVDLDTGNILYPMLMKFELVSYPKVYDKSNNIIYVNFSKLKYPLEIRKWKNGEYFFPIGMNGKQKKLSKFFKDERYNLVEKKSQWLLCSDDDVIWVIGKRQDERFKLTSKLDKVLKISLLN